MKQAPRGGQLQIFKAEFFKALAHPVRIRILEILVRGGRSVHELQEALGVDQPTVSQQLAVLRAKNIVDARKEGTAVRYTVRDASVRELLDVTRRIFDNHLIGTQTMLRELRREAPPPLTCASSPRSSRIGLATEPLPPGGDEVVRLLHEVDAQVPAPVRPRARDPGGGCGLVQRL